MAILISTYLTTCGYWNTIHCKNKWVVLLVTSVTSQWSSIVVIKEVYTSIAYFNPITIMDFFKEKRY